MKLEKGKLFWKSENFKNKVYFINWDESVEYYTFLKKQHDKNYHQVIISTEIFMSLLKHLALDNGYIITSIEFMEEDESYSSEIDTLISTIEANPTYIVYLLDLLKPISEKSSIEIKSIRFKNRINNIAQQLYIQSNGIIGINKESFTCVFDKVCPIIERCLFG